VASEEALQAAGMQVLEQVASTQPGRRQILEMNLLSNLLRHRPQAGAGLARLVLGGQPVPEHELRRLLALGRDGSCQPWRVRLWE
jgi:hypothetical protein